MLQNLQRIGSHRYQQMLQGLTCRPTLEKNFEIVVGVAERENLHQLLTRTDLKRPIIDGIQMLHQYLLNGIEILNRFSIHGIDRSLQKSRTAGSIVSLQQLIILLGRQKGSLLHTNGCIDLREACFTHGPPPILPGL